MDAARLAFGKGREFIAVPEIRLLDAPGAKGNRKIGKVDFLLAEVRDQQATDFAALEIQSVYISGYSIRPAFNQYLAEGVLPEDAARRPDFRSSAQKRLMPQLALKVPIFRRWGKRFFVAVDSTFFETLPKMRTQTAGNAEVTWLVYPFVRQSAGGYRMEDPVIHQTSGTTCSTRFAKGDRQKEMTFFSSCPSKSGSEASSVVRARLFSPPSFLFRPSPHTPTAHWDRG